jgi:hypothetical protein
MGIMRTRQLAAWLAAATVYAAGTLGSDWVVAATGKDAAPVAQKFDNATCQTCHDGKKGKLEVTAADGAKRPLQTVNTDKYGKSVHAKMECVACHREIIDSVTPHQKVAGAPKVECAQCHLDLWEAAKKDNKTVEKPRLGIVAENVAAYRKSFTPSRTRTSRTSRTHLQRLPQRAHL